ncbi:MAG TPA: ABC transporter substrate-binding protein, partial [Gemmatimonadales bacterium]|nr:ABC transporter substrate-binding protein [Gemmatimonadales bacterium]
DLQSINPLLTVHPLARQVQRYVLLTTLVRYDSALAVQPYLAKSWAWSPDHRELRFHLVPGVLWHDGMPTTARDVEWTLDAARDPRTAYPRLADLAPLEKLEAPDDTTVVLQFSSPQESVPDVLTDLAILPRHLLDSVPLDRMRQAAWNQHPVGNGPFRFVTHEANRKWVFAADSAFPASLGGPPQLSRLVIAVVDEPMTKLAALASGELDFAGIQPAHAEFVKKNPRLAVYDYPLLFDYVLVLNTRIPPFSDLATRTRVAQAVDRQEIVDGFLFGFGTPIEGPHRPEARGTTPTDMSSVPSSAPTAPSAPSAESVSPALSFELLTVGSGEAALEQLLQHQFQRQGITISIRQLELSAFLDRVQGPNHEYQAAVMGVPGDLALGYLAPLLRTAGFTPAADTTGQLKQLADSTPVVFLYQARGVQGMNRRVRDVRMDQRGELATVARWTVAQ